MCTTSEDSGCIHLMGERDGGDARICDSLMRMHMGQTSTERHLTVIQTEHKSRSPPSASPIKRVKSENST